MGGGLAADCGGRNIGFSTPFGAVLKIIAKGKWLDINNSHRFDTYGYQAVKEATLHRSEVASCSR